MSDSIKDNRPGFIGNFNKAFTFVDPAIESERMNALEKRGIFVGAYFLFEDVNQLGKKVEYPVQVVSIESNQNIGLARINERTGHITQMDKLFSPHADVFTRPLTQEELDKHLKNS